MNHIWKSKLFATLSCLLMTTVICNFATAQETPLTFDDNVKSILRQRCASCHSPDTKKGSLDVTNYTALMEGGSSGAVIEPGDLDFSYLYNLVTHNEQPVMPPSGKIPDAEIETIRKWIEAGALENKGSKAVIKKKAVTAMTENPLVRPESIAQWPLIAKAPVQHTARNPVTSSLAVSPWSPVAAVAGKNQVLLFDTATLELLGVLPFPEGTVNVVRFSRTGSVLLVAGGRAGQSGVAVLWDVESGERITTIGDELDAVLAADISPDHSMVALGGPGKVVNVYSTSTGEVVFSIKKHTEWITALAFSTDGVLLATGDRNGGLLVWESMTGRPYLTLKGHTASINAISWRADSNIVASCSNDASVRLWELNNGGQVKTWNAHGGGTSDLVFTRDGRLLTTGVDKNTKLWQQDGAELKAFPAFADIATAVAWCNESNRAIAGDYLGEIRVWNPDDATQIGSLTANPATLEIRLAQTQQQLAKHIADLQPVTAQLTASTQQLAVLDTELKAAVVTQQAAQKLVDEVRASMTVNSEKVTQLNAQLAVQQKQLAEFNAAKPHIDAAAIQLAEASAKLPGDEALKQQHATLVARGTNLATQIQEATAVVTTTQASITELTSQVQANDEKTKAADMALKVATDAVTATNAKIAPVKVAAATLAEQTRVTTAARDEATTQVAKLQNEIAFAEQLKQLNAERQAAQALVAQHQAAAATAEQQANEARSKLDAAKGVVTAAEQTVQEIEARIQSARQKPVAAEPPVAEVPAAEPPVAEVPAAEPPVAEVPAAETPAAETPAAETPAAKPPVAETPSAAAPATPAPATPAPATPAPATPAPAGGS